jgi:hypothetical protein
MLYQLKYLLRMKWNDLWMNAWFPKTRRRCGMFVAKIQERCVASQVTRGSSLVFIWTFRCDQSPIHVCKYNGQFIRDDNSTYYWHSLLHVPTANSRSQTQMFNSSSSGLQMQGTRNINAAWIRCINCAENSWTPVKVMWRNSSLLQHSA